MRKKSWAVSAVKGSKILLPLQESDAQRGQSGAAAGEVAGGGEGRKAFWGGSVQ